jgi:tetratricopeptide (TPR) repeat protein
MPPDSPAADQPPSRGTYPLTAAVRHKLQKVYEHAQRCVDKGDFDYGHRLFAECVSEDPSSDIYLKGMLGNLQRKYNNNKKGAKFAGLKVKSHRSALLKAADKGEWQAAFAAGCAALAINPWDTPTLLALAKACGDLEIDECRLIYLRTALDVDSKDPIVNREAALALTHMGQFDQAIACWHRVEQAKPHDEEAVQAISRLSVEKTIHQGGYDSRTLGGKASSPAGARPVAGIARGGGLASKNSDTQEQGDQPDAEEKVPLETRLKAAVQEAPAEVEPYLQLADLYLHEQRIDEARQVLERGQQATGGGDLRIRERLEEVQLRAAQHHARQAQQNHDHQQTPETKKLLDRALRHVNQVELEVYLARCQREPQNPRLQLELGLRLKRAGKHKEAIRALQSARGDTKRKPLVLLELGECFQKIEQYKLALSNYEQAIEADADPHGTTRKLALYRAGVLATGLRELDRAERHLTELAGVDYGYRDVSERLDKVARLRDSG